MSIASKDGNAKQALMYSNTRSVDHYCTLRKSARWNEFSEEVVREALKKSDSLISAIADGTTVRMARLITDRTQALMMDVVAHPHFQGRGIGKSLMQHVVQYIENTHSNVLLVHLMTPGVNTGFYETLGFGKHSSNNIIAMRLQCAMSYIAVPPYCRGGRPRLSAKRRHNHGSS